jgi:hypothetical protein
MMASPPHRNRKKGKKRNVYTCFDIDSFAASFFSGVVGRSLHCLALLAAGKASGILYLCVAPLGFISSA